MTRIPAPQALALRRVILAACCMAATLGAHASAAGGVHVRPGAPVAWAGLLCLLAVAGPRRGWRARGAGRTLALALCLQAAAHVALTVAPWAAGIAPHHAAHAAAGPSQIVPHLVAAGLTALLVARLERWIGRAAAVARRVRRWFAATPGPPPAPRPVAGPARRTLAGRAPGAHPTRGPPLLRTA